jgi:hypothetical protein
MFVTTIEFCEIMWRYRIYWGYDAAGLVVDGTKPRGREKGAEKRRAVEMDFFHVDTKFLCTPSTPSYCVRWIFKIGALSVALEERLRSKIATAEGATGV